MEVFMTALLPDSTSSLTISIGEGIYEEKLEKELQSGEEGRRRIKLGAYVEEGREKD